MRFRSLPASLSIRSVASLFAALAAVATIPAQAGQAAPPPLGQAATASLVTSYGTAEHWVQKAVVLLSLNQWWHPAGTAIVVDALRNKDARLHAFGLEALLRCDAALPPAIATTELLDELIARQLPRSNEFLHKRVLEALHRLVPAADATDKAAWSKWWSANKETFAPAPWAAKEPPAAGAGGTTAVAACAFDLYQFGLDLMICIDSTGSMQPTIDALGQALGDMVDILDGLSPKLRLGVVHYKDYGELGKIGAKVLQPFTKNVGTVKKTLEELRALGGGDLPEAVLGGLEVALDPKMNWSKDANKLIVLIGDAPPHPQDQDKVLELVRTAYEAPGSTPGKPTTGVKPVEKPFLTSAIGVLLDLPPRAHAHPEYPKFVDSQRQMQADFKAIAKAGGGVYVSVEFQVTDDVDEKGKAKKARDKEKDKLQDDAVAGGATRRIVEHILVLSFGERFTHEMHDFVRVFYEYKGAGLIK